MNEIAMLMAAASGQRLAPEDVFSVNSYRGQASDKKIESGINLLGADALIWTKDTKNYGHHTLRISSLGLGSTLSADLTDQLFVTTPPLTNNANGDTVGVLALHGDGHTVPNGDTTVNIPGALMTSWTFRKSSRFFDIVSYTGNGASRSISHGLGVAPGMIIIKRLDVASAWTAYHKGLDLNGRIFLNTTAAQENSANTFPSAPTASQFSLGNNSAVNASGGSYVALVFADDSAADGVIKCGSTVAISSSMTVSSIGWEPQFVLYKRIDSTGDWFVADSKRGVGANPGISWVTRVNTGDAETSTTLAQFDPSGFSVPTAAGGTYIWMAIRGGPSRKISDRLKLFNTVLFNGSSASQDVSGTPIKDVDLSIWFNRNFAYQRTVFDRARGEGAALDSNSYNVQAVNTFAARMNVDGGMIFPSTWYNVTGEQNGVWMFKRARGFLDIIQYTGTGAARTVAHELGAAPRFWIVKRCRGANEATGAWIAGFAVDPTRGLNLFGVWITGSAVWNNTAPVDGLIHLGTSDYTNKNGELYVAYLFGDLPGVSKTGSYVGTGGTQDIGLGLAGSVRLAMIHGGPASTLRIYDSVRGITSESSPYLDFSPATAQVTNSDLKPLFGGFSVTGGLNTLGNTYYYFVIA